MPVDMSARAFREHGYLQEVNRQLLHPLGLALYTTIDEQGHEELGGIEDHRRSGVKLCDPKDAEHAQLRVQRETAIRGEWEKREPDRVAELGYMIQPVDG